MIIYIEILNCTFDFLCVNLIIYNECLHALFVPIANTGHTFGVTHPWEESKLPAPFLEVVENIQEFILD